MTHKAKLQEVFCSWFLFLAMLFATFACKSNRNEPPRKNDAEASKPAPPPSVPTSDPLPTSPPASAATPSDPARPYQGPPLRLSMLQLQTAPPQNVVNATVTVPTGGWELQVDKVEVQNGVVRMHLTLEKPGQDEIVTQAFNDLSATHKTVEPVTAAEVYVHLAQRGISTLTTDYRLAAKH